MWEILRQTLKIEVKGWLLAKLEMMEEKDGKVGMFGWS